MLLISGSPCGFVMVLILRSVGVSSVADELETYASSIFRVKTNLGYESVSLKRRKHSSLPQCAQTQD
jgi:hypothetical protein